MKNLKEWGYPHYCVTKEGQVYSLYSNKFLKVSTTKAGYYMVTLCEDTVKTNILVHRLIATAYLDNLEDKPCVNHKDGIKTNNQVENLEWCTYQENTKHAMDTGLHRTEVINDYRTISDHDAAKICDMLEEGSRVKDIAETYGLNHSVICGIKSGKFYRDISKDYNFRNVPSQNRVSESKVLKICKLLSEGLSINAVRLEVKVSHHTVSRIKRRETYTYLSNNFKW